MRVVQKETIDPLRRVFYRPYLTAFTSAVSYDAAIHRIIASMSAMFRFYQRSAARPKAQEMIMSTGIGKHQYSTNHRDVYHPDLAICPYCGFDSCEADHVDIGIGMEQCGPYYCPQCEASEISSLDKRELTAREQETGWFEPGSPVSDVANTVNGQLVDHKEAKQAYDIGLLDVKKSAREAS